jgi:hypothetical protein
MKTGTCLTPYGADGCCVSGIFIYFRETVGGSERRNKTIAQWRTAAAAITYDVSLYTVTDPLLTADVATNPGRYTIANKSR